MKIAVYSMVVTLLLATMGSIQWKPAHAAVGDVITVLNLEHIHPSSNWCSIGVAFDGTYLYTTGCSDPKIYKITTTGTLVSSFDVVSAGSSVDPNALAFDAKRNGIWFGGQSCDSDGMPIHFWDFDTDTVTKMFTIPFGLTNPATGSPFLFYCFVDGLAYNENDPNTDADDEIWFSDDVNSNLGRFKPDGTLIAGFDARVVDPSLASLSGLAIGGPEIYMGNNGGGQIFRASKDTLAPVPPVPFSASSERTEDMECDPVTFAPKEVMWVRDTPQGNPNHNLLRAIEIESGKCGFGGQQPKPSELTIKKFVQVSDKGIHVDEMIDFLKDAEIVEATVVGPDGTTHVYHGIPASIPAFIPWDGKWDPSVRLDDGKWQLHIEIIAFYEDPVTGELKKVTQKVIIHFDVVKGMISTTTGEPLKMEKVINVKPHPAQLNGHIDITLGEDITPGEQNVFITEVTLVKPSGTVISYTALPVDITAAVVTIPFPGANWNALGSNPKIAIDELGMWELKVEFTAFYEDGVKEIKSIEQKVWVSFNVIPESIIGAIAPVGAAIAAFTGYRYYTSKKGKRQQEAR